MQARDPFYLYWDSSIFLAYLNHEPGRVEAIDRAWSAVVESEGSRVVTAAISIAEVSYAAHEKLRKALDPQAQSRIDAMWGDPSVLLVETPPQVMFLARDMMREVTPRGWALRPYDAVHLATAAWVHKQIYPVSEFHTYDDRLRKYTELIDIPIVEPG
jgi:predicted nucleic acid-binding protein